MTIEIDNYGKDYFYYNKTQGGKVYQMIIHFDLIEKITFNYDISAYVYENGITHTISETDFPRLKLWLQSYGWKFI